MSQALIDLADDFKNIVDMKDLQIKILKEKLIDSRKNLIITYSAIRQIDNRLAIVPDTEPLFKQLIENLRCNISYNIEKFIIADVGGVPSDDED